MDPATSGSPPNVLAILPGWMPSTLMDVVKPMLALERRGCIRFRVALEPYLNLAQLERTDLVVFCRNIDPRYSNVLQAVQERSLPFIYDIDDNLFDVPVEVNGSEYYRAPGRGEQLHRYLASASLVRVYSPVLFERIHPLNPNVRLVTPPLDWNLVSNPPQRPADAPLKIVYATSRSNDTLYEIFAPALDRILCDYPERVSAHFWGFQPPALLGRKEVHFQPFILNYDRFLRLFSRQGFDIGLAPLRDDIFHQSKTNNKFREYGACGIAGVYSDVPLYSGWVEPGITGILAQNTVESWYAAMRELLDRPELRRSIAAAAEARVRREYSQEQFLQMWNQMVIETLSDYPHPQRSTPPPASVSDHTEARNSALRRTADLARSRRIGHSLVNSRIHLNNLWWQFKINTLKRL